MNNLSWFLYIADVLYQQGTFLALLCVITPPIYLLSRLISRLSAENITHRDGPAAIKRAEEEKARPFITTYKFFTYPLIGLFLLFFVPNKDTFYLIAASEAGEMVVNTPEAQEIMSSLQEILNVQLNKLKEAE